MPLAPSPGVASDLPPERRRAVVRHVLAAVYPDRLEASVVGTADDDAGLLVGVKAHPRGYISTAKYALVTVDADGQVVGGERCTGRELRRALDVE